MVGRILLQVLPYVVPLELREEAPDIFLVFELRRIWCRDLNSLDLGIESCDVEEMAATPAALNLSVLLCMRRLSTYRRKLPSLFFSDLHGLSWCGLDGVQSSRFDPPWLCNDDSRTCGSEESNGFHIDHTIKR